MIRRIAGVGAAALVTMLASVTSMAAEGDPQEQWRSYWVDSFNNSIYTPENVDKLVADAQDVNANVLIVQVGRWMDCFCNRSSFPRTHVSIDQDFDPLDDVIEKGHAAGLEVHAWVNATPAWNLATPPTDPDHVLNTHGHDAEGWDNWLNKRSDGSEIGGANLRVLDPANPAATDYVVEGIESIVREYDVDGINLDFIRYPDYNMYEGSNYHSNWGYSDASLDRFRTATGRTDVPEPDDAQFSDWRREQLTNYVRKIYLTMYEADPQDALSINGITYWYGPQTEGGWEATRTHSEVLQDWRAWMAEGIIDVNVAMNYKAETNVGDRIQMYDEWLETLADSQGKRFAVNGPALYLNDLEASVDQARRGLQPTAAGNRVVGWSGYSYANPSYATAFEGADADAERSALVTMLTEEDPSGEAPLFAEPADVPELTWKTQPEAGHATGELVTTRGTPLDQVEITATNLKTGETVTERTTDGAGWFGFVELAPGTWMVRADLPDGVVGKALDIVHVTKGGLATAKFGPLIEIQ
jgi:uncharacterized lipoprotein YddW (UPF0748 family)